MDSLEQELYSVSDLNAQVRELVESSFPQVAVVGEVSNFKPAASGHWYFTLKDESAQLRSVCWRSTVRRLDVDIDDGMRVILRGRLTVYEQYGQYQFVVDSIEPAGLGKLEVAFRQLVARLRAEGLFDAKHKQELPEFPQKVAIVTSPTGAAIRDMLSTLRRRWPIAEVLVVPVTVQGPGAREQLANALERLAERDDIDVVLMGRGGGSLEDLWAFNEEVVARAAFDFPWPLVSGVGHETDTTILDFVADVRAATPTMAAELATPDVSEVKREFDRTLVRLARAVSGRLQLTRARIDRLLSSYALGRVRGRIDRHLMQVDHAIDRLRRNVSDRVRHGNDRLTAAESKLNALNPKAVLARGYAICHDSHGNVVRTADVALRQRKMNVTFSDGNVPVEVEETA